MYFFTENKTKISVSSSFFLLLDKYWCRLKVRFIFPLCAYLQGKDLYMDLDSQHLTLVDPQDLSVLNVQPIQSIRVWGVGRDNGRLVVCCYLQFSAYDSHL